jgi:transcriptional regulator with XRE-family HTH domain
MPRRHRPDPFARKVGARIRELRAEAGLTLEGLAFQADVSKGHLSDLEKGLVRPNTQTLKLLADQLGITPFDLLVFPDDGLRQQLIERTRKLSRTALMRLVRNAEDLKEE